MECQDLVSISRPIFASLCFGLEGFRFVSVWKDTGIGAKPTRKTKQVYVPVSIGR